jgi:hypothetical protein
MNIVLFFECVAIGSRPLQECCDCILKWLRMIALG